MADEIQMSGWRKKFLATRMTFESIMFEREMLMPQKEKMSVGILGLAGIWLLHALLLTQWVMRRGYFFIREDAEGFTAVLRFADYLQTHGAWALVKPDLSGLALNPPFYSLAYVPVLRYLTTDLNLALVIVNSFFLLVTALSVFLAVRKSRPNRAGWLGAAFALALPFVLETARRPAPEMALMAFVAAVYACYILSEEFEQTRWTFWFGICLGLGFYSHRFFWLYTLPLLPFILTGFTSPMTRDELFKGSFPGVVLNAPWYLFAVTAAVTGFLSWHGGSQAFLACFKTGAASAGLPLFSMGALALAWMHFSVFMPYEKRKMLVALFAVPYLALTWLLGAGHPELFYPAMLFPFAIAVPVMTPHPVRRYLLVFALALGVINQSGLVPPLSIGSYSFGGLPLPPGKTYKAEEVLSLVKANVPAGNGLIGIYGADAGINADSLRFAADAAGVKAKFENSPACPACASLLLNRTQASTAAVLNQAGSFSGVARQDWFAGLFEKKAELKLGDSSTLEFYVKTRGREKLFEEGVYKLRPLSLGSLHIEDATLGIAGYEADSGSYAKGEFFVPSASMLGGDIYGLALQITGLELAGTGRDPVPVGAKSVRIISGKISEYALERLLTERFPSLAELKVTLEDKLAISAFARGYKVDADLTLALPKPGVLEIRPAAFTFGYLSVPSYVLGLFSYRFDFSDNPYGLTLSGLRIRNQMLELY
ncbi:MAG TPA: glycosyltransferase family 39 protein [Elusimicrobiales bacterium]|nr:glycosyltransferase family 39 protein [Elusimicrobiales bacterium]